MTQRIFVAPTLLQGKRYTPAENTNITKTWRAAGWKPKHKPVRTPRLDYERASNTVA